MRYIYREGLSRKQKEKSKGRAITEIEKKKKKKKSRNATARLAGSYIAKRCKGLHIAV
jgi:hypothetical protein